MMMHGLANFKLEWILKKYRLHKVTVFHLSFSTRKYVGKWKQHCKVRHFAYVPPGLTPKLDILSPLLT